MLISDEIVLKKNTKNAGSPFVCTTQINCKRRGYKAEVEVVRRKCSKRSRSRAGVDQQIAIFQSTGHQASGSAVVYITCIVSYRVT